MDRRVDPRRRAPEPFPYLFPCVVQLVWLLYLLDPSTMGMSLAEWLPVQCFLSSFWAYRGMVAVCQSLGYA